LHELTVNCWSLFPDGGTYRRR